MIRIQKICGPCLPVVWSLCFLLVFSCHVMASGNENSGLNTHDHAGLNDTGSDEADQSDAHQSDAQQSDEQQSDEQHDHGKMIMEVENQDQDPADQVKVQELLGRYIDLGARFSDAGGRVVEMAAIFDKPVVLLPIWFLCPSVCSFLQADLAKALNKVGQQPGEDFNVITLSFSDDENPSHARAAKKNYANLIQREFPMESWYYLTGDQENIRRVTDSLGYFFIKKKEHFYIHPNVLAVLAKDGKIIRYLYGPGFLPFDLGMALQEASKGEPGISIKRRMLSFCFDYDPENKTYVFKMFRITGTIILALLAGFVIFLLRPSKKHKQAGKKQ